MQAQNPVLLETVIRRVGGLEGPGDRNVRQAGVIRRVGGLEELDATPYEPDVVIRRVGGLEALGGTLRAVGGRYPPCRRLRSSQKRNKTPSLLLSAV